ncbi:thiamine-monophosphate kinase [Thermoplasmatales archaeon BRNA1]|nr:thiamine-monophosphate kinase [Thermoplasmatales archaeon BRNA1]
MAALKDVGERKLVENIRNIVRPRSADTVIGMGDDAAVVKCPGDLVVSTDVVSAERHMPSGMTYEQFGWTAAAVNFSDLASMGARPVGFLAAISAPGDMEEADLYDIVSGIDQCCEHVGTDVIGGDTKPGALSVAGTAVGSMDGLTPMTRNGARPGDLVAVTGTLGLAAAGYYSIEAGIEEADDERFALNVPLPHIDDGIRMAKSGIVTSCMDLSDGLANAARTICRQSHVGMEIEWEFLPVGENVEDICRQAGKDVKDAVLRWGGDYELMFTFRKDKVQKLYDSGLVFSIIGIVNNDSGPVLAEDGSRSEMGDGIY